MGALLLVSLGLPESGLGKIPRPFASYTGASLFAARPDGKLLLYGFTQKEKCFGTVDCPSRRLIVARMKRSGDLDPSFGGGDGIADVRVDGSPPVITDAVLQDDGKIVLAGADSASDQHASFVARLLSDGRADPSFGEGGSVELPAEDISAGGSFGLLSGGLGVLSDGRIVLGGYRFITPPHGSRYHEFAVTALLPSGDVDTSFGDDGTVSGPFDGGDLDSYAGGIAILPGDQILVSGTSVTDTFVSRIALAQLLPDGSFDQRFGGGDGIVIEPSISDRSGGSPIVANGRISVVGFSGSRLIDSHSCTNGLVARYNTDGTPDLDYGIGGKRVFGCVSPFRAAATAHGGLMVAGTADQYEVSYPLVGRLNGDGSLDEAFNRGSFLRPLRPDGLQGGSTGLLQVGSSSYFSGVTSRATCLQQRGRRAPCWSTTVTKLAADGSISRSFGVAGVASFPPIRTCRRSPLRPCERKPSRTRPAAG